MLMMVFHLVISDCCIVVVSCEMMPCCQIWMRMALRSPVFFVCLVVILIIVFLFVGGLDSVVVTKMVEQVKRVEVVMC